ncbi:hypothetical protein CNEO2_1420004 [Clostridium neonatale]|nr:hypothetical protein CNEO2_1400004 [Clostridium neonatale]CAI3543785.1 hypothetical protein CNEO2_1420004 [Clostridium neonatale]CAI3570297.1 hypothetical protein CNEO2_1250004 [Clostridium neonatale]CAI3581733.1 hypothetical protein CNEO2_1420004 [Clostridium neonatale]CAI3583118.1 hypothetical protein CNEO2_1420004 [Clostridium neonatale]
MPSHRHTRSKSEKICCLYAYVTGKTFNFLVVKSDGEGFYKTYCWQGAATLVMKKLK